MPWRLMNTCHGVMSVQERYEGQENQLLEVMTHVTIPPKLLPKLEKDYAVTKVRSYPPPLPPWTDQYTAIP